MASTRDQNALACPHCGYDLTSLTSARCPECGRVFVLVSPEARRKPPRPGFLSTSSMWCSDCGTLAAGFMPRHCHHCGRSFTLRERILGVGGFRLG